MRQRIEKVVMAESDEAATYRTGLSGWVSRDGCYWGEDERMARWDGSTHHKCPECGGLVERGRIDCHACYEKRRSEAYDAMPKQEWDGKAPLVLFDTETYFWDEDGVRDYCDDEGLKPEDLKLVMCVPIYAALLDVDHWGDDLPGDDGEPPDWLVDAVDKLNATIREKNEPLSWVQGKIAVIVSD